MTQPEAMNRTIKLALRLEGFGQNEAAAELRRLHEVNQELLVALKDLINCADTNRDWTELKAARAAIAKGETK
jgi:hypothetical protein